MATKNIAGITAKLGLDISGVTSALKQIESNSKNIAKEMKEVDNAFKIDPNSLVVATQKQELLAQAISNTENKLKELESVQEQADRAFKNQSKWEEKYTPLKASIDETKNKLKELQSQNEKMQSDLANGKISTQQYEAYQTELEQTKQKMNELKQAEKDLENEFSDGHISAEEYRTFQRELETTRAQLNSLQNEANENQQAMTDLANGIDRTSDEYRNARTSVKDYSTAVSDLNSSISKVSGDLKGLATAAAAAVAAVTTAAIKAVGAAAEVGSEFEASMSKVKAVSGASADDMERLEEAARTMGATTSKTASESAQALSYMALAGWNTQQMLAGLEPILRASEAGEMDLATCSDLVTDSMSAMGLSVNELSHYLDVVASAQNNSNTSMQDLLNALVTCGGTAKNFGLSIEDVSTALGVMANRGIKGAEAGNSLNSIFVNMLGTTKKTEAAMDALGLELYDDSGAMKDMTTVLKEMGTALADATDEQRNNLEAMLGGKTQLTALQALVGGLNDEYDDLSKTLNNANGALQSTAKTMQDNLQGSLTTMQSALEGLGIGVYEHLEGPFKEAVNNITKEISNLSESVDNGELGESLAKLADELSQIVKAATKFAVDKGIPSLIKNLQWVIDNGNAIVAILKGIAAGFAAWKVAQLTTDIVQMVNAIKAFKAAQEAATEAQLAANAAAMANVYAIVAAAIAVVVVALGELAAAFIDAQAEELKHKNELDDTVKALREEAAAIDDVNKKTAENCEAVDETAEAAHRWWEKIQSLVDETGTCTGNVSELQMAVNALNEITGENIQLVNNQIVGYNGLCDSIDKVIEKQRMQSKLEYLKDPYGEAVAKIDAAKTALDEAEKAESAAREDYQRLVDIQNRKEKGQLTDAESRYAGYTKAAMQHIVDNAHDKYAQSIVAANALRDEVRGYNEAIDAYETAFTELNTKTEDASKAGEKTADSFAEGIKNGSDAITESVEDSVNKAFNTAKEGGQSIGSAAAEGIKAAISNGMEDNDLKKLVSSYMDGLDIEQLKNGYDAQWLVDEQRKIISALDETSDVYKKYEKQILQSEKKIADSKTKTTKVDTTEKKTEKELYEENAKVVKETMAKTYKSAISKGKSVGEAAALAMADGIKGGLNDTDLKSAMSDFVEKLDIAKAEGGKTSEWYYEQLALAISTLDKEGSLYQSFYKKVVDGRNKVSEEDSKANAKETKEAEAKAQKLETLTKQYQQSMGSAFRTNTDANGVKTQSVDTAYVEKIVRAKEKLSPLLQKLSESGMPQSVIDELLGMDPIEAVKYAEILIKSPKKFEAVKSLAQRDAAAAKKLAEASLGTDSEYADAGTEAGEAYGTALSDAAVSKITELLPDITAPLAQIMSQFESSAAKADSQKLAVASAQLNTETSTGQTNAAMETIMAMMNELVQKGINVTVNPVVETTVTLDGDAIAKSTTKKQTESQIRNNS